MPPDDDDALLEHVAARNMRDLRGERGWSQADLASYMKINGFTWTPNRVAQLETLRRPVSLLELLGLAWTFGVGVDRLLAGEDRVALPNGDTVALEQVRQALCGEQGQTVRRVTAAERLAERDAREDLRKIAQRLGLTVNVVKRLSDELWGQSLIAEREQRVGDVTSVSPRSAQTRRGHVTRALVAELEQHLGDRDRQQLVDDDQRRIKESLAQRAPKGEQQ